MQVSNGENKLIEKTKDMDEGRWKLAEGSACIHLHS
jgi:hypothetical protein